MVENLTAQIDRKNLTKILKLACDQAWSPCTSREGGGGGLRHFHIVIGFAYLQGLHSHKNSKSSQSFCHLCFDTTKTHKPFFQHLQAFCCRLLLLHSILVPDLAKHVDKEWLSSMNYKISTSLRFIWPICKNSYSILFKGPLLFKPHNNMLHVPCCIKTQRTICVVILSYAVHMRQAYCWKWTVSSGTRQPQILTLHVHLKTVNEKPYHPPESTGNCFCLSPLRAESAYFGLWGSLSVKEVSEVLSFLKWEFKWKWPREQNIKCWSCSTNVAWGYRQNIFHIYAHARALSALSPLGQLMDQLASDSCTNRKVKCI